MSRFCFCNCPAGFSAAPERHAPDCPGRFGAGKAPTPVPATLPASKPVDSCVDFGIDGRSVRVSQEAYSIFLAREAAGREKIAALQQRLTAADEQIDLLTPRHTEQPEGKRERFEKWVMATKHPVYGFLDGRSLARGDDRTGYADEYVQGLWVAYLAFGVEQPAPVAVSHLSVKRYDRDSVSGHSDVEVALPEMTHYDHGPNLAEALARLAGRVARFHKLDAPTLATQPAPVAVVTDEQVVPVRRAWLEDWAMELVLAAQDGGTMSNQVEHLLQLHPKQ